MAALVAKSASATTLVNGVMCVVLSSERVRAASEHRGSDDSRPAFNRLSHPRMFSTRHHVHPRSSGCTFGGASVALVTGCPVLWLCKKSTRSSNLGCKLRCSAPEHPCGSVAPETMKTGKPRRGLLDDGPVRLVRRSPTSRCNGLVGVSAAYEGFRRRRLLRGHQPIQRRGNGGGCRRRLHWTSYRGRPPQRGRPLISRRVPLRNTARKRNCGRA
mgnify:CR=1 FL=1